MSLETRMRCHVVSVKNRDVGRDLHSRLRRVDPRKMRGRVRKESGKEGLAAAS